MIRIAAVLFAWFAIVSVGLSAGAPAKGDRPAVPVVAGIERKLHGTWKGPACGGTFTFKPDGTYTLEHYSPGNHTLAGTWTMRWDALPPTLVLACKSSEQADYVGKTWELKVVKLDDKAFHYARVEPESEMHFERSDLAKAAKESQIPNPVR
jgi:hypothetical protein